MEARYQYKVFELLSEVVHFLRDHDIDRKDIVAILLIYNSEKIGLIYQEWWYD